MACTTLLAGKDATFDGSTIVARNEDCENGDFNPKRLVVVEPADQPRHYRGVNSGLAIDLPDDPVRYTCIPNVDPADGVWGEAGINAWNVAMSATETITTNARVLGADPLVERTADSPGGIGEEDLVTIVLPYIRTAREGVERLGSLLERHGTYEENGIAFGDKDEVWYLETVGGHHWIARRVPDDAYVAQPNQLGIDRLDLADALGAQTDFMASADLARWMAEKHLAPALGDGGELVDGVPRIFNPRQAFGSATWRDHVYNTPRAWYIQRCLNPSDSYDGPDARYRPESDTLPWCRVPERKVCVEDVKTVLSSHYQNTEFDCYGSMGDEASRKRYRPIGINRTCELSILQVRGHLPAGCAAIQWVAMGSGPFNTCVPFYTNVASVPSYLDTGTEVDTAKLYWQDRLIAAMADPEYYGNSSALMEYVQTTLAASLAAVATTDAAFAANGDPSLLEEANERACRRVRRSTDALLAQVLQTRSLAMANAFDMGDH